MGRHDYDNQQPDTDSSREVSGHHQLSPGVLLARKIFFGILLVVVVIISWGLIRASHLYTQAKTTSQKIYAPVQVTKQRKTHTLLQQGQPISILLMGTDTGAYGRTYTGRTDTLIVMVLNPERKNMTLISLPRDAAVTVSDHEEEGVAKLNSAYTYGGPKAAIKTVQNYLNIPIDYYMLVNMGGLSNMVNAVGGIDIKPLLTFKYYYNFTKDKLTHMNGDMALQYCRMRHDDPLGDYGRQTRQRQVMMAVLKKAINIKAMATDEFLKSVTKQARTDLTFDDLTMLALKYRQTTTKIDSTHLQGVGKEINGVDFEVASQKEKQKITNLIRKNLNLEVRTTGYDSNISPYQPLPNNQ